MVKIMQTIHKERTPKLVVLILLVLFLYLSFQLPVARASTSHQTIPTAPPTTSVTPTITSTSTPISASTSTAINPPQTTVPATQKTLVLPSQTPGSTISPTGGAISSTVPSATELPGLGTIPVLTATLLPAEATQIASTTPYIPTATVTPKTNLPGYREILYCLLCGVIVLILVLGFVWFIKSRRRQSD
jgi:hypothetical protein